MAKASRQTAFDAEFRGCIEQLTPKLVAALRAIMSKTPPPAVNVLSFEARSDWDAFPVHVFAMSDESPDEVYFKPPFSGTVLTMRAPLIRRGAIDQDAYEEAGVATFRKRCPRRPPRHLSRAPPRLVAGVTAGHRRERRRRRETICANLRR